MILDGIEGIEQLQKRYAENLIIMFLIKDKENKYLIMKTPFFDNQFSFPCFKTRENLGEEINKFIYAECGFISTLNKFIERIPGVCLFKKNLTTTEFLGFSLKKDDEITNETKSFLGNPIPSGNYSESKFVTLEELKTMYFSKMIDSTTMYYALRDGEIPLNSGTTTVTFDTTMGD